MDQDKVGIVSGSSYASVTTTDYRYARQLVEAYFVMLTVGCQRDECSNGNCISNPETPVLSASEAAIKSIYFATRAPVRLCIDFEEQHEKESPAKEISTFVNQQELELPSEQAEEDNQSVDEHYRSNEELPETSEAEVLKPQEPENIIQTSQTERQSTPRQRLSIAVQLDNGINKNTKRPTVITRVIVQPKHKPVIAPVSIAVAETTAVEQQQEHEQTTLKMSSPIKDTRKLRLSRPKERLFDAIKRSFSRTKKASLGSAS